MSTRPTSDITLWFLNSSRAIRAAWALESLELPYKLIATDRAKNGLAPAEWKAQVPTPLHKSPAIKDGDQIVYESGAVLEYLCDRYDTAGALYPKDVATRNEVRVWLHAAEGTFAVHCMPILYARWNIPEKAKEYLGEMEKGMSVNMHNDLGWLEGQLQAQKEKGRDFLVGEGLSIADMQMHFMIRSPLAAPSLSHWVASGDHPEFLRSADKRILFIYERAISVSYGDGRFPEVEAWLKRLESTPSFKKTKERTGFTMDGDFKK